MNDLDRREFISFVGKACAGATASAAVDVGASAAPRDDAGRTIYRGRNLMQIAMPMGGLGAGNVAIGGGGNLRNWQIFNQCNPRAQLKASFFAVRAKVEGGEPVAKLLQLEPVGTLPTIDDVEFIGEYPFAFLRYLDKQLPVEISMECYSPLIPLNVKDSGIPGVVFRFKVRNPGPRKVEVSLAQTLQNPVGFDGYDSFEAAIGNVNEFTGRDGSGTLVFRSDGPRIDSGFDQPVVVHCDSRSVAPIASLLYNCDFRFNDTLPLNALRPRSSGSVAATRTNLKHHAEPGDRYGHNHIVTFEAAPNVVLTDDVTPGAQLNALAGFVEKGGGVVILGGAGLLQALQPANAVRDDVIFDDFEAPTYDPSKWTVEGAAFGKGPAKGTLPGQQPVTGFQGTALINSFLGGDEPTGKMTSKPFTIDRRYIHLLVGGGDYPGEECVNLRVDGKVVRTATGRNEERLRPVSWDVAEFVGKSATFEIVDALSGGWGHINVDALTFSDGVAPLPPMTDEDRSELRRFVPFELESVGPPAAGSDKDFPNLPSISGFRPHPDATIERSDLGAPIAVRWKLGAGNVCWLLTSVNDAFPKSTVRFEPREQLLAKAVAFACGVKPVGIGLGHAPGVSPTHPYYGSVAIHASGGRATAQPQRELLNSFWSSFARDGALKAGVPPADPGISPQGAIAVSATLKPGEEREFAFRLGWSFPNRFRDSSYDVGFGAEIPLYQVKYRLGNRYSNWFKNAKKVVEYLAANDARLHAETKRFHDSLFDSTLPPVFLDAISSQISTLRSQTSMWLEDGTWAAYEGLGCCPMNCTHVYNYAQTMAKLFPELERNVRRTDLTVQLQPDGGVRHRVQLPFSVARSTGPFADGHLSTISKAYREHLQSPDRAFLTEFWLAIKLATQFAIDRYDANGDGLVEGDQPNTYDCKVVGHNSFISSQYLASLAAAEAMAKLMGDDAFAKRCRSLRELGAVNMDRELWNGDYYQQRFDAYLTTPTQYGPGCLIDQLLGQWWAHVNGLGHLLPEDRVRTALRSILKSSFVDEFTNWNYHGQRVFANGKDQGVVCCSWPKGGRPTKVVPILYCDEVWTGEEYQLAGHLVYEGLIDEAVKVVTALRARYNGANRNPWNEIECSDHYGRAMAAWTLLLASSGYRHDGPAGMLAFDPRLTPDEFRCFFSTAEGWGRFEQRRVNGVQTNTLTIDYGRLVLNELRLGGAAPQPANIAVILGPDGRKPPFTLSTFENETRIRFGTCVTLPNGASLHITI